MDVEVVLGLDKRQGGSTRDGMDQIPSRAILGMSA